MNAPFPDSLLEILRARSVLQGEERPFLDRLIDFIQELPNLTTPQNRKLLLRNIPLELADEASDSLPALLNLIPEIVKMGKVIGPDAYAISILLENAHSFTQHLKKDFHRLSLIKELNELISLFEKHQPKRPARGKTHSEIPIAIVAMNQSEFDDLEAGKHLANSSSSQDAKQWAQLQNALAKIEPRLSLPLRDCYNNKREQWLPIPFRKKSIDEIVRDSVKKLGVSIEPMYLSEEFLSEDLHTRIYATEILKGGGLIIIDAISLLHYYLRQQVMLIQGADKITFLTISPQDSYQLPINRFLENLYETALPNPFTQFKNIDALHEFGIGNEYGLQRCLYSLTRELSEPTPGPNQKEILRNQSNHRPRRIQDRFTGGGGS